MIKTEDISIPGFGPPTKDFDPKDYAVRYLKANLDEVDQRMELELLETRGIGGNEVVTLQRQNFTFMDKFFIIVQYLEKKAD